MSLDSEYDQIYDSRVNLSSSQHQFSISTLEFINHYEKSAQNDFLEFKKEYQILQSESNSSKEKQNQLKDEIQKLTQIQFDLHNQHFHVNQVRISLSKSCFTNEFLKAIFISEAEYSNNFQYILSQDPNTNTIIDFLKMIWENEISLIVLISKKMKNRMFQYWSTPGKYDYKMSTFTVKNNKEKEQENLTIRELIITNAGCKRDTQKIIQLHLKVSLKDKMYLKSSYQNLIENIYEMKARKNEKLRILFHASEPYLEECSKLMCIDKIIGNLCDGIQDINIYQTVLELNQYEKFSLTNEDQYLFIFERIYQFLVGSIKVITPRM